jgi:hypothetical protein
VRFHPGNSVFAASFACLILAVITTASIEPQEAGLARLSDTDLATLVIHFERTACYGDCPAYKLTIYGDGRIEYEGIKNVKLVGRKQGDLANAELTHLVSQFNRADFFKINQYSEKSCSCTLCTDMPTAIIEIKVRGMSHRVEHYYGCRCAPKMLWDLEATIDKIANTERWTGDVSKQGPRGTTCFNPRESY